MHSFSYHNVMDRRKELLKQYRALIALHAIKMLDLCTSDLLNTLSTEVQLVWCVFQSRRQQWRTECNDDTSTDALAAQRAKVMHHFISVILCMHHQRYTISFVIQPSSHLAVEL